MSEAAVKPHPLRLLFLLGSRGEWGYIRPVITEARRRGHDATICATNMALLSSHGSLVEDVVAEGYDVGYRVLNALEGGTREAMAKSLGLLQISFVDTLVQEAPDWVVLAGDLAEQMAAATACAYTYTPTAHIQAGERSGNIDGVARHAIGRLVHLHFAANQDSVQRLIKSGEQPWRVHLTGAPQLDEIHQMKLPQADDISYNRVRPRGKFILACFHPVTEEIEETKAHVEATLQVLAEQNLPVVWILPNNDAGGSQVRSQILSGIRGEDQAFANLPRDQYLALMRDCELLIGNSSSGLLEAPSFGTPAVNIGRRQNERLHGPNVVNVSTGASEDIQAGLELALQPIFQSQIVSHDNPYGDGLSSPRILDLLETTSRDSSLLNKQITY